MGLRQQDLLVHKSRGKLTLAYFMSQAVEHWVKMMKRHLRNNCNHRTGWMKRLMNFMDCLTVGSIGYNLIDFKNCVLQHLKIKEMMYEPTTTPMIECNLLANIPNRFFVFHGKVNKIQFRDPIPDDLRNIWNAHLRSNSEINDLESHANDLNPFNSVEECYSWDDQFDGDFDKNFKNLTKTQIMEKMQQRTQDTCT